MFSIVLRLSALAIAVLALVRAPPEADLQPATLAAFDRYVTLTEARMAGEMSGASPFLWIDRQADGRPALLEKLKRGEVVSARLQTRDGKAEIDVPDGLIHHWVGTVLLPGATIGRVMAFVKDYPQYPARFAPMIQRARVLKQSPDRFDVSMRTWAKKVVTVVIDADYGVDYRTLRPTSVVTKSVVSNVYEVEGAGTPGEQRTPAESRPGLPLAPQHLLLVRRAARGRLRAVRVHLAHARRAVRPRVDDQAVHHEHSTGDDGIHVGKVRAGAGK